MTSKRNIDATNEAGFLAKNVKIVVFARLDFLTAGVQRFHTEIGPKNATHPIHGSELYTGLGDFGGIDGEITESISGAAQNLRMIFNGVNATLVNDIMTDTYFRRDAEIMIGLENESGALLADPVILFSGFMGKADIALKQGLGQISITCESRGVKFQRASDHRYTDEDKQAEVSGDLFGEYIYRMADLVLRWGDREFRSPFGTSPPSGPGGTTRGRDPGGRYNLP